MKPFVVTYRNAENTFVQKRFGTETDAKAAAVRLANETAHYVELSWPGPLGWNRQRKLIHPVVSAATN